MADEKLLTPREALHYLHQQLKPIADQYAKDLEELHKKEKLAKVLPGELSKQPVSDGTPPPAPPPAPVAKDEMDGDGGDGFAMGEPCAKCGMKKCDCYGKSEKFPDAPAPKVKEVSAGQENQGDIKKLPMKKDELAKGAMPPPPPAAATGLVGSKIPPAHPGMKPMKLPGMTSPKPAAAAPAPGPAMKKSFSPEDLATVQKQSPQLRPRDAMKQAIKLPGARAAASGLMDKMLVSPSPTAPLKAGATLPASGPSVHLAGVGQPTPAPATGVQTMTERVASKVPAKPMGAPPKLALPGAKPAAAAPPPVPAGAKPAQPKVGK